jgi:hypothetical protein
MIARGLLGALIVASLVAGVASASAGPALRSAPSPKAIPPGPPNFAPALSRVVSSRVYHTRLSVVRNSTSHRIGRSLASLDPTWVTGLLRYARNQFPTRDEVRVWKRIRNIVHRTSPGAQFDVVLNAEQYRTPLAVTRAMRRLNAKLGNEGWFFDFFSSAARRHPKMIKAAIAWAHTNGQWIGGNVFGLRRDTAFPVNADFLSVQDDGFHLNLPAVLKISKRVPVLYHLNNDPDDKYSGGCRFIKKYNTARRRQLIRRRASSQIRYGFRMSYPALFPECIHPRPRGPGTYLASYNAFRDPPMAREIQALLDRYDFNPAT